MIEQLMSRADLSYRAKASELVLLISSKEFSTNYLWTRFSNSSAFCEGKVRDKINVTFKRAGLATTVMGTCSCSTQRKVSHKWSIEPQRNLDIKSEIKNVAINQGVILSAYSFGCGYRKLLRGLACLGLKFMHFRSFKKCEEKVGRALQKVAHEAMEEGLQKEKEKSDTFSTIQNGTPSELTGSVDMG